MNIISWGNATFQGEITINAMAQNSNAKEIQIIMPQNSVMNEHKAPFDISVQVLCGEIEFSVGNDIARLKALDMVNLKANEAHSLRAIENSILRLSLAQGDKVSRVENVAKK